MKPILLLLVAVGITSTSYAQSTPKANRDALPIAAHYKRLAQLNRAPGAERASLDTITFSASAASTTSKTALTLPSVYLADVPELLRIPPPPANSSAQTRAELDYLLQVQATRKPEDIQQAKQLAELYYIPLLTDATHPHFADNNRALFYAGSPFGEWFVAKNLPEMTRLLGRVLQDSTLR